MRAANRTFRRVAAGACLSIFLVGCTSGADRTGPEGDRSTPTAHAPPSLSSDEPRLSCSDSIATTPDPGERYRVLADAVAVPSVAVVPANASADEPGPTRLFAKWGLLVRAGAAVEVRVAPGWEEKARVGWGPPAEPTLAVHVQACPGTSGGWSVFAGGTWVAEPACLPLLIRSGNQRVEVRLPIGGPCVPTPSAAP